MSGISASLTKWFSERPQWLQIAATRLLQQHELTDKDVEEALDIAIDTLAEGKLIGLISHVPTLKERISSQIQIMPQTGGRSIVSGPGCGRISQSTE